MAVAAADPPPLAFSVVKLLLKRCRFNGVWVGTGLAGVVDGELSTVPDSVIRWSGRSTERALFINSDDSISPAVLAEHKEVECRCTEPSSLPVGRMALVLPENVPEQITREPLICRCPGSFDPGRRGPIDTGGPESEGVGIRALVPFVQGVMTDDSPVTALVHPPVARTDPVIRLVREECCCCREC